MILFNEASPDVFNLGSKIKKEITLVASEIRTIWTMESAKTNKIYYASAKLYSSRMELNRTPSWIESMVKFWHDGTVWLTDYDQSYWSDSDVYIQGSIVGDIPCIQVQENRAIEQIVTVEIAIKEVVNNI